MVGAVLADERFHIAEWYGQPFDRLSDEQRVKLAKHRSSKLVMTKSEIERLVELEGKVTSGGLSRREQERLDHLRLKLDEQQSSELPCPFRTDNPYPVCTKAGGVCSMRLMVDGDTGIVPVVGKRGRLRAMCPYRFNQDNTIYRSVGEKLLGDPGPQLAGEVGFLESTGSLDSKAGEHVGRIDMIVVSNKSGATGGLDWAALEIQAVYFSGKKMDTEFKHIVENDGALTMPLERRRPDYRSSGVKRLMPQLQTKVPTLRRWGKKMVVVVDESFFESIGGMRREADMSNADIVWLLVDFVRDGHGGGFELRVIDEVYTTLEDATTGLTGGVPMSLASFEESIRAKIGKFGLQDD